MAEVSLAERRRRLLHAKIKGITGHEAYFQPPTSPTVKLKYPCTVYNLANIYTDQADDMNYKATRRYSLTYITKDPGDEWIDRFLTEFEMISFSRHFTSDGLNHYIFDLYF